MSTDWKIASFAGAGLGLLLIGRWVLKRLFPEPPTDPTTRVESANESLHRHDDLR